MSNVLDNEKTQIRNHSGVSRLTIPEKWAKILNLEPGDNCTRAIVNGKHGLFLAAWSSNQPDLQDISDTELESIQSETDVNTIEVSDSTFSQLQSIVRQENERNPGVDVGLEDVVQTLIDTYHEQR